MHIENYKHRYQTRGKWIYVPNERCVRKGNRLLQFFSKRVNFPSYYYHYSSGGHVAALHAHLQNKLFFKIDIQNFYYSIARMRVTRAMLSWGYQGAGTLAKWSTVCNPINAHPRYVLPIGFVQSPLLASLVLMKSPVHAAIERAISNGVVISVYLDDFVGSHDDQQVLSDAYEDIRQTCGTSGLVPNLRKLVPPSQAIAVFNCDLMHGSAILRQSRIDEYYAKPNRTALGDDSFERYRQRVERANFASA